MMRPYNAMCLIAISAAACLLTLSCRIENRREAREPVGGELSKEEIIEVANVIAREHGYDPDECTVMWDPENASWRGFFVQPEIVDEDARERMHEEGVRRVWPHLIGRDYQVVIYRTSNLDEGLFVLVDKRTGEVLLAFL